jgi:hypothetical protein
MQVCLHELEHKVKILVVLSSYYLMEFDNVRMVELLKEDNFSKGSLSICGVLKRIKNFLESESIVCLLVCDFPDMSVCSAAHLLENSIFLENMFFHLFCHFFFIL